MASLSEMMAYAQAKQPRDPLAEMAGNLIQGTGNAYYAEKDKQEKRKEKELDTILKIIEINDKLESANSKRMNNLYVTNILKSLGIMPYDAKDTAIARTTAGEMIGDGKRPVVDNTESGRLKNIVDNMEKEITFEPDGPKVKLKFLQSDGAKPRTAGQEDDLQKSIATLAERMAQRDYIEDLSMQTDENGNPKFDPSVMNPNNFPVPPDYVDKWMGYSEKILKKNLSGASAELRKNRSLKNPLGAKKPKKKSGFVSFAMNALSLGQKGE